MSTQGAGGVSTQGERDGEALLAPLRDLPGAPQLLRAVEGREDAELVGGATRDLLLGRVPRELDVVVEHGAAALARELARALAEDSQTHADAGVEQGAYERFETAFVRWSEGRIDIATR